MGEMRDAMLDRFDDEREAARPRKAQRYTLVPCELRPGSFRLSGPGLDGWLPVIAPNKDEAENLLRALERVYRAGRTAAFSDLRRLLAEGA